MVITPCAARARTWAVAAALGSLPSACGPDASGTTGPVHHERPAELVPEGVARCVDAHPQLTVDSLSQDAVQVAIDAVPRVGVGCTRMECTDGRECCNSCSGEYAAHLGGYQVQLRGLPGCSGMDCDVVCEPFGRTPTTAYRFIGSYTATDHVLTVDSYCVP